MAHTLVSQHAKMFNLDDITNELNEEHNEEHKMAIYSRSCIQNVNNRRFWIRKTNALLNLIKEEDNDNSFDKIY